MGLDLVNIARTGVARVGLARLNAGEVEYDAIVAAITASGSAAVLVDPYVVTMSGGGVLSGNANQTAEFIPTISSGLAVVQGSIGFTIDFTGTLSGGAALSGVDAVTILEYLASMTGAAATAGAADVLADYNADASGEAATTGTATPFIIEMIGNMGGTADLSGGASDLYADYFDVSAFQGNAEITGTSVVIFTIDVKGLPVYIRRFDGDVRLSLSADGGIIKLRGGQPEIDEGLETAVNISLFSEPDYWGNALSSPDEEIGSPLLSVFRAPLANQARLDIIEAVRTALAWMVSSGIATSIEPTATIPSVGRLDLFIVIRQPEKAPATFRYTVNWQNQAIAMQEAA